MPARKRAPVYILEGTWDNHHELPQTLPYLDAYQRTFGRIKLMHRSFRNAEDLAYYIGRIPKDARAFIYISSHASAGALYPTGVKDKIPTEKVLEALKQAKQDAVAFLHFGCCEFVRGDDVGRRDHLGKLLDSVNGGQCVSGYTSVVDWLQSTLLDIVLIDEVYVPWFVAPNKIAAAETRAMAFVQNYEQLQRVLGFSAMSRLRGNDTLFPARVAAPRRRARP